LVVNKGQTGHGVSGHSGGASDAVRQSDRLSIATLPVQKKPAGKIEEGDMELLFHGPAMLLFAFGFLAFIWVMVLWGSRAFGSPPEH
jgi:hypothetical protein